MHPHGGIINNCGTEQAFGLQAFELALAQAALKLPQIKPEDIVFFDDSTRNIKGADACNIRTVLVGSKDAATPALAEVDNLHELRAALPELWDLRGTVRTDSHFILPALENGVKASAT